jgi:hypothetical protein
MSGYDRFGRVVAYALWGVGMSSLTIAADYPWLWVMATPALLVSAACVVARILPEEADHE